MNLKWVGLSKPASAQPSPLLLLNIILIPIYQHIIIKLKKYYNNTIDIVIYSILIIS